MKKLFSTCIAIMSFSVLMAQSVTSQEVPYSIKTSFQKEFKNTTVQWTTSLEYYVATWDSNNKHKVAYYAKTNEATLVRTETDVPLTELTEATQNTITTRFMAQGSTYTFVRAFKIENFELSSEGCEMNMGNNNTIRLYFDATGTLVKRELNR